MRFHQEEPSRHILQIVCSTSKQFDPLLPLSWKSDQEDNSPKMSNRKFTEDRFPSFPEKIYISI